MNITVSGQSISLTQSHFKGAGGEGNIYVRNGTAYKIYHDPAKMIPAGKIKELSAVASNNVLAPLDIIYAGSDPVGFTMQFVSDTEYLCKLFTKTFRDKNGVTPAVINKLVKAMQDTLSGIHKKSILAVDINEMNFLVNKTFEVPYFIDVDSYKTPSYPATALMESVRDRKVKGNQFTNESDWFSFAVVAFQLYVGCHPYKGRHPDFAPKDWMQMMDKGISVFNSKCRMPPATQDMSLIPAGHKKWFEAIFEKGERSAPPAPDSIQIVAAAPTAKIINSNASFNVDLVQSFDSEVTQVRFINGIRYTLTKNAVYTEQRKSGSFAVDGISSRRTVRELVPTIGGDPVIASFNSINSIVKVETFGGASVCEFMSTGMFVSKTNLFIVTKESLVEVAFLRSNNRISPMQTIVASIFHNHVIFEGLVVQNMLGTCRAAIPIGSNRCASVHFKELDKARVIDAKHEQGICVIMAEERGVFNRYTFFFSKDYASYTMRLEKDVDFEDVNFTVKHNGVCIAQNSDKLEAFADSSKTKLFDSPLSDSQTLTNDGAKVFVYGNKSVYSVVAK